MKILAVSDIESKYLWDYYEKEKLKDIDFILSAGDLNPRYLSFLVTVTSCPLFYVHGNHDSGYMHAPPEGCICVDDKIYTHNGIRILGLGGCMEYTGGSYQYTERQMRRRISKLWLEIKKNKGFDILLTHAPAFRVNDGEDLPHRGFECFLNLINKYSPTFFIHGHFHKTYSRNFKRFDRLGSTCIINSYERFIFDYNNPPC